VELNLGASSGTALQLKDALYSRLSEGVLRV
jgi:hypothetical protein